MDSDDLEPKAKIINTDFDTLSISELELYILDLEAEIIKCKNYILSKSKDRELAESIFKK
ncbi:DUF1192 domain-containing protein [Pelagibacterales bacterium]|jgi:uncharacterized small protein (DUF1192 family)|nr:DUF1192 domain-containing protein [Pelagibacterales bacterium]